MSWFSCDDCKIKDIQIKRLLDNQGPADWELRCDIDIMKRQCFRYEEQLRQWQERTEKEVNKWKASFLELQVKYGELLDKKESDGK